MRRTPEQIAEVLTKVEAYWQSHPTQRFAQVVCNAADAHNRAFHGDPFHCEDDELLDGLRNLAER